VVLPTLFRLVLFSCSDKKFNLAAEGNSVPCFEDKDRVRVAPHSPLAGVPQPRLGVCKQPGRNELPVPRHGHHIRVPTLQQRRSVPDPHLQREVSADSGRDFDNHLRRRTRSGTHTASHEKNCAHCHRPDSRIHPFTACIRRGETCCLLRTGTRATISVPIALELISRLPPISRMRARQANSTAGTVIAKAVRELSAAFRCHSLSHARSLDCRPSAG
jgi:hypothetical protein